MEGWGKGNGCVTEEGGGGKRNGCVTEDGGGGHGKWVCNREEGV